MKLIFLRSCFFFLISLSWQCQAASKDITNDVYVSYIYSAARQAWPALENVWDTQMYRQLRLVVADDNNAWAIDSKSLTKLPYSEIQRRNLPVEYMHYQEIQWTDGRPTIYVSLGASIPPEEKARFQSREESVPELFNVATHEAFHFFVQTNVWKRISPDNNSRATIYPIQVAPRFYRNSIIRSLYATLRGEENGLGHARYWFDKWKGLYPDDASHIRQTDIYEGSARYIEIAAEIIAEGKSFNTSGFQNALINKMSADVNFIRTQSDSESYSIGALSGFIMNMKNLKWQPSVVKGMPPLDVLLESTLPIKPQADKKLEAEVNEEVNKIRSNFGSAIDNFYKAYYYPNVVKIFVSSELSGSFSLSGGFFRTKKIPHDLMVGVSSSANWTEGSYSVEEVVAASIDNFPGFRGKKGFLILYAGKLPASDKGRLVLKTGKMSLNIPYPVGVEESRIIYLP